jgi:hypothetical protein
VAREQGWSLDFAQRAVDEYRKFVYLAVTVSHRVMPGVPIETVWAMHATETRSYWDEMCRDVLGRPLHREGHWGGRGGAAWEETGDGGSARSGAGGAMAALGAIARIATGAISRGSGDGAGRRERASEEPTAPPLWMVGVLMGVALLCTIAVHRHRGQVRAGFVR